jgi:hypothetical protein
VSRTLTPLPTDRAMWRRLLRLAHPDHHGTHDLFIWVQALQEHVAGDAVEEPPPYARRAPPRHHEQTDRLDCTGAFDHFVSHDSLTQHAVDMSSEMEAPYAWVLSLLEDCYPAAPTDTNLTRQESVGVSYKQLAYIAHLSGMDNKARSRFYRIAEGIPMSQRMAGHIIARLRADPQAA